MGKYIPRLAAPSTTDKNWIHTSRSGYNSCIHIAGGSVLPNCVGYAWGRWCELLGKAPLLSRGNAELWWRNTGDGYERGQTPRLGAVICWRKGEVGNSADGAGHVAVVEQIKPDGTIVTSNSAYGGKRWYTKEHKPPYNFGSFTFQGFIYLPITFEEEKPQKSLDDIARAVIRGEYGNGAERKKRLKAEGHDPEAVQARVNELLTGAPAKPQKSLDDIARAVIRGEYGNGAERKKRLKAEGHDPEAVQARVNELL